MSEESRADERRGLEARATVPSRNDGVTVACLVCRQPLGPSPRRRYCSDRCRQAAWRQRQPQVLPEFPRRSPRFATIYECGSCETRQLGEQWCSDCQRPSRRIGLGVLCPHCDEPLALSDFWPG